MPFQPGPSIFNGTSCPPTPPSFPCPHDALSPNPLRPHILAPDWLTRWLTPFGVNHMNALASFFPPHLIAMSCTILYKSVATSTLSNYSSGLLWFSQFCDDYQILELLRMPASEALLTIFITCRGTVSISASTIRHWLLGLELWHEINGAPWFGCLTLRRAVKVTSILMSLTSHP